MGRTIALVACVGEKQEGPCPAKDLYTTLLFRGTRKYAEDHADDWFILSAAHGLVKPTDTLSYYNTYLKTFSEAEKIAWAGKVLEKLDPLIKPDDKIIFLASIDYRKHLETFFSARGCTIEIPMKGLFIGQQNAWCKRYLETGVAGPAAGHTQADASEPSPPAKPRQPTLF